MLRNDVFSRRSELRCMLTRHGVSDDTKDNIRGILKYNDDTFTFNEEAPKLISQAKAETEVFMRKAEVDALTMRMEAQYPRENDGIPKFPAPDDKIYQKLNAIKVTTRIKQLRKEKEQLLDQTQDNN